MVTDVDTDVGVDLDVIYTVYDSFFEVSKQARYK